MIKSEIAAAHEATVARRAPSARHSSMTARPRSLTIEALPHGGFVVFHPETYMRGLPHSIVAAFSRLPDAVGWVEEQLQLADTAADEGSR